MVVIKRVNQFVTYELQKRFEDENFIEYEQEPKLGCVLI